MLYGVRGPTKTGSDDMGTAAVVAVVDVVTISHPDHLVRDPATLGTVNSRERPKPKQLAKRAVSVTPSRNHRNPAMQY